MLSRAFKGDEKRREKKEMGSLKTPRYKNEDKKSRPDWWLLTGGCTQVRNGILSADMVTSTAVQPFAPTTTTTTSGVGRKNQ